MPDFAPSMAFITQPPEYGMWAVDLATRAWIWSQEFKAVLGLPDESRACWETFLARVHPEDLTSLASLQGQLPAALPDATFRVRRFVDGELRWLKTTSRAVSGHDGQPGQILGMIQDITDRRRAELERDASELRLNTVLKIGRMVVWDLDLSSGIVTRSANAEEVIGICREPIVDFVARVHPADRHMVSWESSDDPSPPSKDVRFRYLHPNGTQLWLESAAIKVELESAVGHVVGITMDVTERQTYEEKLVLAANQDPLTGLLNRKAWRHAIEAAISEGGSLRQPFSVLLLDVDHFKFINDTLGHDAGDAVLQCVAKRLLAVPRVMSVARLGGDEFAACVATTEEKDVVQSARGLLRELAKPIAIGERTIVVGGSIGLARCPDDGTEAGELVKNADLALYAAKRAGRGTARLFEPPMRAVLDRRLAMESEIARAMDAGEIVPFYQPKVDLLTGALVGFEALARWLHPSRGVLTPAAFGAIFDHTEIASRLDCVMRKAIVADVSRWRRDGLEVGAIAINCAAHDFRSHDPSGVILDVWTSAGLPPNSLVVEVTEGVIVGRNAETVARTLHDLHDAGVRISLDDFGTGYASLIHLRQLPVDEIKLDRSFLADMDGPANMAIVKAVLAMGTSLGLSTVAEGVETHAQAETLRALGCNQAQGYLYAKPMSASRVPWFVRHGSKATRPVHVGRALAR